MLIILAVISINAVLGENGLIHKAEKAGEYQANAEAEDRANLGTLDQYLANAMAGNGESTQTPTDPENPETPKELENKWKQFVAQCSKIYMLDTNGNVYKEEMVTNENLLASQLGKLIIENGKVVDVSSYGDYIMKNGRAYCYNNDEFICCNDEIEVLKNKQIIYISEYIITNEGKAYDYNGICLNDEVVILNDRKILNAGPYQLTDSEEVLMVILEDQKAYYINSEDELICFSDLYDELKDKKITSSYISEVANLITEEGKVYSYFANESMCVNESYNMQDKKFIKLSETFLITEDGKAFFISPEEKKCINDDIEVLKNEKIIAFDSSLGLIWLEGGKSYYSINEDTIFSNVMEILIGKDIVQIESGDDHTVAVDSEGKVWSWGENYSGQLGDGTETNSSIPTCISEIEDHPLNGIEIVQIEAGSRATVAVDSEGKVWSWGWNEAGQLGDGTETNSSIPICISEIEEHTLNGIEIVQISIGNGHTVAVDKEGKVWSWGWNEAGRLGDGTKTDSSIPICISGIEDHPLNGIEIVQISIGNGHTVAVDKEGKVWSWGINYDGQLGDGTDANSNIPICISEIENHPLNGIETVEIEANHLWTILLDSNNKYYIFGRSDSGK